MEQNHNIKNFGSYRDFLQRHFNWKKKQNPNWSYGLWAKKLGLNTTSSLTKIMTGHREPGSSITQKFIEYFQFDALESHYFQDLIRLSKLKDDLRLKIMLMEKMGREHPDLKIKLLDDKSFSIISNWYCMAIREMVRLEDFSENSDWIQSKLLFPVTEEKIKLAIQDLLHQGLLKRNMTGKLVPSSGVLTTTNDIASKAIQKYHTQMLDIAKLSLKESPVSEREFTSETLTINTENLSAAKELIREFKSKFSRLFEEQQGNKTYQLQIQFFSLTKETFNESEKQNGH